MTSIKTYLAWQLKFVECEVHFLSLYSCIQAKIIVFLAIKWIWRLKRKTRKRKGRLKMICYGDGWKKKSTISSRDQVLCGGYHLHCRVRRTEHDQIAVGKYADLDPFYHNPSSNDILGSAELHGWWQLGLLCTFVLFGGWEDYIFVHLDHLL